MNKFLKEFKDFAMRGNVIDLAVGVIIGGAFKGIVDSLVANILSPIIGVIAQEDLSALTISLGEVELRYGAFLTAVINFILMAFVIFLLVKGLNALATVGKKKEETVEAVTTKVCPFCRSEIAIEASRCPHCTSSLQE